MINYVLLALGVFTILTAIILIFLDKVKGDDIYFSMDVKEQEIKKVIDDAEEIISELNYTSEMVVKEIEDKLKGLREEVKNLTVPAPAAAAPTKIVTPAVSIARTSGTSKKKKLTNDTADKDNTLDPKLSKKQQAVFDYAAQGMSVIDIAKKMNIGQGEVMLILSLKNEVE